MKNNIKDLKIALVHDFLTNLGGAERVLAALHELFPLAPIFTLAYDSEGTRNRFMDCDIRVAKLYRTWLGKSRTWSLPFLPNASESLRLNDFDIVISSSSAFAKGVITRPETLHICYCHTPMRYVWDWTHEYAKEKGYSTGVKSLFGRLVIHYLRLWDQASAERVDRWIANSKNVQNRIKKYYRFDSTVIYPPVEINESATKHSPVDTPYFLVVSRLSAYKRIDLAIQACARLGLSLVVIGEGTEREKLEDLAKALHAKVAFLGYQTDSEIADFYAHARAFLFTGEDDFGITPVEAMSFGKPVIAYGKGGALETIIDGKTGLFFSQPTVDSLHQALLWFIEHEQSFQSEQIKKRAKLFSAAIFKKRILAYIEKAWQDYKEIA